MINGPHLFRKNLLTIFGAFAKPLSHPELFIKQLNYRQISLKIVQSSATFRKDHSITPAFPKTTQSSELFQNYPIVIDLSHKTA